MASAVVLLKHETSTLRQSHNLISIDFTFGVGDYVREVTSPTNFGSDERSIRHMGATYTRPVTFLFLFSSTNNIANAHTRGPIFAQNNSEDGIWC